MYFYPGSLISHQPATQMLAPRALKSMSFPICLCSMPTKAIRCLVLSPAPQTQGLKGQFLPPVGLPFLTFPRRLKKQREMRQLGSNGEHFKHQPNGAGSSYSAEYPIRERKLWESVGMVLVGCDLGQRGPVRIPI